MPEPIFFAATGACFHSVSKADIRLSVTNRLMRLTATWAVAFWLIAGVVFGGGATVAIAGQTASGQGLGSADEYMQSNPDSYVQGNPGFATYESPLLGIAVKSGTGGLEHGTVRYTTSLARLINGVEILTVTPGSPAETAGLQGCRPGLFRTTALTIGILAAAALFPPAMMGAMALSGIGQSHETIIAVDGERTHDLTQFEEAIEKAESGEVVYLTVVRGGRREQVRVALPVQ